MKELIAQKIKKVLDKKRIKFKIEDIQKYVEIPPDSEFGDYAFPCFFLAEKFRQNPNEIATDLRKDIDETGFEEVRVQGGYLNFFINRKEFSKDIIKQILSKKDSFGSSSLETEKIMVEFSQPNTHKAFHVGHIRGTSLGESLSRILEFCGNKVIRANYMGDTGMHIAKWIWCYKKYHPREKLRDDESWISGIYVDAVKRLARNEKLQKEVDIINKSLFEHSDKELDALWQKTRKMSLDSFEKIYRQLNARFDVYFFESQMEEEGKKISEQLLKDKIAKVSDGAVIINLEKYNLGVWVLLRSDKTVLYSAKDLALAEDKFRDYKISKSIYVVGAAQTLHMQQLFKTLELMKFPNAKNCIHIPFSEVRLPTGKMSSRTGENVLYSDFLEEMTKYAEKEIKSREPKIKSEELKNRALKISIACMKYSMLKQSANKNIIFNPKEAINFEGDTGAYILYSYARASSILKKAVRKAREKNSAIELEKAEFELVKKLSQFPEVVENSCKTLNPSSIAVYSYQLAQIFNEFYHSSQVIGSEEETFRILLVDSFRQVLKNALNLLGIDVIEKM
ncbi:MAG TPA: arginine--tRNA ligase [Patescibacteria group bacterium]|nr:arginine--tRNA ligase [Patescibacteria group bacterium]